MSRTVSNYYARLNRSSSISSCFYMSFSFSIMARFIYGSTSFFSPFAFIIHPISGFCLLRLTMIKSLNGLCRLSMPFCSRYWAVLHLSIKLRLKSIFFTKLCFNLEGLVIRGSIWVLNFHSFLLLPQLLVDSFFLTIPLGPLLRFTHAPVMSWSCLDATPQLCLIIVTWIWSCSCWFGLDRLFLTLPLQFHYFLVTFDWQKTKIIRTDSLVKLIRLLLPLFIEAYVWLFLTLPIIPTLFHLLKLLATWLSVHTTQMILLL